MNSPPPPRRTFTRLYYTTAALLLAALACLPVLVPLSYALFGFEPGVRGTNTPEAFDAARATAPFRRGFVYGVSVVAVAVLTLSAAVPVLRRRGRRDLPRAVPVAVTALAAILALAFAFVALVAPHPVLCC